MHRAAMERFIYRLVCNYKEWKMKCKNYNYTQSEAGRSMIEMVGVLAITGLLTAGAFVLIQSGMSSQKRKRATDEVNMLAQSVRALTAEGENFNNLPAASENALNGRGNTLAKALLKSGGTTPFGDDTYYVITQGDDYHHTNWFSWHGITNNGNATLFRVGLINLDDDDCYVLSKQGWGDTWDASCVDGAVYLYFGK